MGSTPSKLSPPESCPDPCDDQSFEQERQRQGSFHIIPPTTRCRTNIHGYTIYAYPSTGGMLIKHTADMVDMNFLGWDRFAPVSERFSLAQHENEFCRLLRKAGGAEHWRDMEEYSDVSLSVDPHRLDRPKWYFAWPGIETHPSAEALMRPCTSTFPISTTNEESRSDMKLEENGVWALEDDGIDYFDTGKLRMCMTMEEKVEQMKRLGATFYQDPRACPGLRDAYPEIVE